MIIIIYLFFGNANLSTPSGIKKCMSPSVRTRDSARATIARKFNVSNEMKAVHDSIRRISISF